LLTVFWVISRDVNLPAGSRSDRVRLASLILTLKLLVTLTPTIIITLTLTTNLSLN